MPRLNNKSHLQRDALMPQLNRALTCTENPASASASGVCAMRRSWPLAAKVAGEPAPGRVPLASALAMAATSEGLAAGLAAQALRSATAASLQRCCLSRRRPSTSRLKG